MLLDTNNFPFAFAICPLSSEYMKMIVKDDTRWRFFSSSSRFYFFLVRLNIGMVTTRAKQKAKAANKQPLRSHFHKFCLVGCAFSGLLVQIEIQAKEQNRKRNKKEVKYKKKTKTTILFFRSFLFSFTDILISRLSHIIHHSFSSISTLFIYFCIFCIFFCFLDCV